MSPSIEDTKRRLAEARQASRHLPINSRNHVSEHLADNTPYWKHSTTYYIDLGEYLKILLGEGDLSSKVVVDIGCAAGWGVLYLRETYGIDCYGIDGKLNEWYPIGWGEFEKDHQRVKKLDTISGKLIEDELSSIDSHFAQEAVDAIAFVYWSDKHYDFCESELNHVLMVIKPNGYILMVAMDGYPKFFKNLVKNGKLVEKFEALLQPEVPLHSKGTYILQKKL